MSPILNMDTVLMLLCEIAKSSTDMQVSAERLTALCRSHELLRVLVKDLLVELRSKDGESNKELMERAIKVAQ